MISSEDEAKGRIRSEGREAERQYYTPIVKNLEIQVESLTKQLEERTRQLKQAVSEFNSNG